MGGAGEVVKDQGGKLLTGIGGGGSAEDRVGFRVLRHRMIGGRSGWAGRRMGRGGRGFRGLRGPRMAGGLLAALLLQLLQFPQAGMAAS